jgi:hypothetical protein
MLCIFQIFIFQQLPLYSLSDLLLRRKRSINALFIILQQQQPMNCQCVVLKHSLKIKSWQKLSRIRSGNQHGAIKCWLLGTRLPKMVVTWQKQSNNWRILIDSDNELINVDRTDALFHKRTSNLGKKYYQ